ncbi:MAG TPA: tRNA cyclic N6-threonylcarbamoyladenosine(37) synthase TcdA [Ruminococcaceae bacterium]|nr:tRNA cyclic N6-threonylcarbamoyladenosine(37) synthase TcdA [Oscillospiraceae bacterium]
MLNEFSRTELLIGKPALERLGASHVAIFGIGGVGSYTAEALARSNIGTLTLIDDDRICLTNINRQLHALHSTVGKYKAEVMADRIRDINPHIQVNVCKVFYTAQTAPQVFHTEWDYIVDAMDTVSAKLDLIERAEKHHVPIISCMGAANKLDPTRLELADIYETSICPLCRVMRRELRRRGIPKLRVVYSQEPAIHPNETEGSSCKYHCICPEGTKRTCTARRQIPGSTAFVPPVAGYILAGEVVKQLTHLDPNENF